MFKPQMVGKVLPQGKYNIKFTCNEVHNLDVIVATAAAAVGVAAKAAAAVKQR